MRADACWHDVCILNLSRHGLGIQTSNPPDRGSYVEIRRGPLVIIARIAWTKGHRAGLRSQDPIVIQAVLREDGISVQAQPQRNGTVDRRRAPRSTVQAHEGSRQLGRAMEFACFGLMACALALSFFGVVEAALARPLEQVRMALK